MKMDVSNRQAPPEESLVFMIICVVILEQL